MSGESRRPSAAMIVAMAALFVALSGSSYAAIKANTVGAKQIKKNAVATSELKNGEVGTADVEDGAITGADIANESVKTEDVSDLGSGDIAGLGGDDITDESLGSADVGGLGSGDVTDESLGSADVGGLGSGDVAPGTFLGGSVTTRFFQHPSDLAEGQSATLTVGCPAGQTGIGGGIRGDATDSEATTVTGTRPAVNATDNTNPPADGGSFAAWRGTVVHNNTTPDVNGIRPEMWVICAATP